MIQANVKGPLRFNPKMKVINASMLAEMAGMKIKYVGRGKRPVRPVVPFK